MTTVEILRAARARLAGQDRLARGRWKELASGRCCTVGAFMAVRGDTFDSVVLVGDPELMTAVNALARAAGLEDWADLPRENDERWELADALAAFDRAIEMEGK